MAMSSRSTFVKFPHPALVPHHLLHTLEMPHAGNDLQAPDKKSYLALKLYQYNLLTGLYMLDPWERYLFSKCTPKVQATTPPQRLGQPWIVLNV